MPASSASCLVVFGCIGFEDFTVGSGEGEGRDVATFRSVCFVGSRYLGDRGLTLFTRVRGRRILRISLLRSSKKFAHTAPCVVHSPLGLVTGFVTLRRRRRCKVVS